LKRFAEKKGKEEKEIIIRFLRHTKRASNDTHKKSLPASRGKKGERKIRRSATNKSQNVVTKKRAEKITQAEWRASV